MGLPLILISGLLLGGSYSMWSQGRGDDQPHRGRQKRIVAVVLGVLGALVLAVGILRGFFS